MRLFCSLSRNLHIRTFIVLWILLSLLILSPFIDAEPSNIPSLSPKNAENILDLLQRGEAYEKKLMDKKQRLYESIRRHKVSSNNQHQQDELYTLAGVQLEDFKAFEDFVLGILQVYDTTVRKDPFKFTNDFRSPALKLTFEFQRAVKLSHQRLKTATGSLSAAAAAAAARAAGAAEAAEASLPDHEAEAVGKAAEMEEDMASIDTTTWGMEDVVNGMLHEVSQHADQLEDEMQNNLMLLSTEDGRVETVLKLTNDQGNGQGDSMVTLIDQDNNEYVMMKPSDTTVITEDIKLIHDIILILIVSFVLGWMFTWIGLPAFFGYILAGIMLGPSGYNRIHEVIQVKTLAQLGVVLIIFVLGLEFSLDKLKRMWRLALGGAVTILLVTVFCFVIMASIIGADIKEAVFVGACISLSSTAVVVKCIKLDHLEHLYGLLVMQDVILGFMLAIIPALSKSGIDVLIAFLNISLSFTIFGLVCYAILRFMPLIPRLLRRVVPIHAITKNHELMLLGTIAICMTMLIVSERLGLGMEIGCFAAGVILRSRKGLYETSLKVIEPVRDTFACLFFASMGLHVYPTFLAKEAFLLFTLAVGVILFKYISTCLTLVVFKFDLQKSSTMAIALAQISEFGFVLASRGKQLSIISREVYYILLAVTAITLIATPLILTALTLINNKRLGLDKGSTGVGGGGGSGSSTGNGGSNTNQFMGTTMVSSNYTSSYPEHENEVITGLQDAEKLA
ncbi:Sodium/hydrogen exchanger family-domain-containing protein [Mycotypha africana]|uniref:Sodium/hydrogen exchanger family-domain-containing protein n=1 Tax=Mycotypha africana TaxID=64632 RepID=UPI002300E3AD|nr:Sodium/hydrogen exchanger family-domain-containing protein [Mycotypha africana]KAI8988013.1 Sodium/hydrogen exchanger family-domain-containing protein [Mycotypha africana]